MTGLLSVDQCNHQRFPNWWLPVRCEVFILSWFAIIHKSNAFTFLDCCLEKNEPFQGTIITAFWHFIVKNPPHIIITSIHKEIKRIIKVIISCCPCRRYDLRFIVIEVPFVYLQLHMKHQPYNAPWWCALHNALMCFALVIRVVKYYNGGFILEIAYSKLSYWWHCRTCAAMIDIGLQ